jgi:hypothetical protein
LPREGGWQLSIPSAGAILSAGDELVVPCYATGMTRPRDSALYSSSIDQFLDSEPAHILGEVVGANDYDLEAEQKRAWQDEITILREALIGVSGRLLLEFDVPRLGACPSNYPDPS